MPTILQADPIVEWNYQGTPISYTVKGKVDALTTTTISAGTKPVAPVQTPKVEAPKKQPQLEVPEVVMNWWGLIILLVAVIGVVAIFISQKPSLRDKIKNWFKR